MKTRSVKLLLLFFALVSKLWGQSSEIETKLNNKELSMTFPSIYFKNNSAEYTFMPYTVDSCLKYIAKNLKDITSFVIWRDNNETEKLTIARIKKIKADLNRYIPSGKIRIQSMGKAQKISRRTISLANNFEQTQYLLSLNSVFDISKSRASLKSKPKKICWHCLLLFKPCQVNTYLFSKL